MPKKIHSPVERWPGHVILKDPIPLMLVLEYERAIDDNRSKFCDEGVRLFLAFHEADEENRPPALELLREHTAHCDEYRPAKTGTEADSTLLPVVLKCVSEWQLDNFPDNPTVDTFPGTPRVDAAKLIDWLVMSVTDIYAGGDLSPDEKNA